MTVQKLAALLLLAGIPPRLLSACVAHCSLESAAFKDAKAIRLNNYSFIAYTSSGNQKHSTPDPFGTQHAYFSNSYYWAVDYVRVLKRGAKRPIDAISITDFGERLLANNYTMTDRATYTNSIVKIEKQIRPDVEKMPYYLIAFGSVLLSALIVPVYYLIHNHK